MLAPRYADHSTPNPLGVVPGPEVAIIRGPKFSPSVAQWEVQSCLFLVLKLNSCFDPRESHEVDFCAGLA